MTHIRKLVSAVCSVLVCLSYSASNAQTVSATGQLDPTQVYTTGNIVQPTVAGSETTPWVNGVYQDQLTCWAWGMTGNCGPNPTVRPGNNINFSFGYTDLYQVQAISSILPSTGLRVNGYNFGFTAKNGNGWDDGRVDQLNAYVAFYGKDGAVKDYTNYDLNSKFNWTVFNYTKDFVTPYADKDLSTVRYGFTGKDNNFWAGPYGPEIYNVNFSLKYSVDQCSVNVLSSPQCPGYADALAKLVPTPVAASTTTTTTTAPTVETVATTGMPAPPPGSPPPPPPGSPPPPDVSQPPPPPQGGPALPGAAPNPVQQASIAAPTANNAQPKVGEVSDSGGGSSKTTVSLSSVLNMISSNQEKTTALEKSVVQAADAQAFSAGESAKQNAEKIAGEAQSQSIAIGNSMSTSVVQSSTGQSVTTQTQNGAVALQGNLQSNTVLNTARQEQANASASAGQQSTGTSTSTQQTNTSTTKQDSVSVGYQFTLQSPKYEPPKFENAYTQPTSVSSQYQPQTTRQEFMVSMVTPSVSYSLVSPTRYVPQVQIEMPSTEGLKFGHKGPVDNAMEAKSFVPQMNTGPQQGDSVKRNVQNNEAAGNVTIDSIAKQPVGYTQYFGMMPDVAFYAPKEIYRNQKTVDNARVMRGLTGGSDALHQEMVNQQYNRGN